jgi:hypothetical protein
LGKLDPTAAQGGRTLLKTITAGLATSFLLALVACSSQSSQQKICSDSTYVTGTEPASTVSLSLDCTFHGGSSTGDGGPGTLTNCNVLYMELDFVGGQVAAYDGGSAFQTLPDGGLSVNSGFQPAPVDGGDTQPQFLIPLPAAAPALDDGSLPSVQIQVPYSLAAPSILNVDDGDVTTGCWAQGQCAGLSVTTAPSSTSSGGYSLGTISGGNLTIVNIGVSDGSQVTLSASGVTLNPPASSTEAVCSDGKIHYLP